MHLHFFKTISGFLQNHLHGTQQQNMPKILFVAPHRPDRSPSQRYRIEQFLEYWSSNGYGNEYAWLINARDDAYFYAPGNWIAKGQIFIKAWLKRRYHLTQAHNFDIVFVQREAFMTGSTRFERGFKKAGAALIFDFDDAIWHMDVSKGNRRLKWLKNPGKTASLIAMSDLVIAGNEYLAEYARHHNPNVVVIPTVIDTDIYLPKPNHTSDKIIIGWTGSHTTIVHFQQALPVLQQLQKKYGNRIGFRVISDHVFTDPILDVEGITWNSATEAEDLAAIHIGIMPMPDNEWSRGKCGFKGLQYMGLAKPVVLSAVGVNVEIISDGENGFLASTSDEWLSKLSRLIDDAELRAKMGAAARKTVETRYSVKAWRDTYLNLFNKLITDKKN